jgi:Cft2 family RNA processing exonuclease
MPWSSLSRGPATSLREAKKDIPDPGGMVCHQGVERNCICRCDIDFVVLTHFDFDHAGGIIMFDDSGEPVITFPRAKHVLKEKEWNDMMKPNSGNINTYWAVNNVMQKSFRG